MAIKGRGRAQVRPLGRQQECVSDSRASFQTLSSLVCRILPTPPTPPSAECEPPPGPAAPTPCSPDYSGLLGISAWYDFPPPWAETRTALWVTGSTMEARQAQQAHDTSSLPPGRVLAAIQCYTR